MIDTVVLIAKEADYLIVNPNLFRPSADNLRKREFVGMSLKNIYKDGSKYLPKVSVINRGYQGCFLRIELSLPKLIFGNNVDEIGLQDKNTIIKELNEVLLAMGIKLLACPSTFPVTGFDVGKNIFLSRGNFSSMVISELSKCELSYTYDLDYKLFRSGSGSVLSFHSNSNSFLTYDKKADLKKPNKRAVDKDRNDIQKFLLSKYTNQEILRIEARLRNKQVIISTLNKIGYFKKEIVLEDLFDLIILKKILNLYWTDLIKSKNSFLFSMVNDENILFDKILKLNPNTKPDEVFKIVGLYGYARMFGMDFTRKMYETKLKGKCWSKFKSAIVQLNLMTDISDCHQWFREVDQAFSVDIKQ